MRLKGAGLRPRNIDQKMFIHIAPGSRHFKYWHCLATEFNRYCSPGSITSTPKLS